MPIEPTTLDLHHFTVRRRGYDRNEVDAVMRRIADSLRRYEIRISELETKLAEADDSVDAVSRTMVAAQRTHDQLIEEATELARSILVDADRDATKSAFAAEETAQRHIENAQRRAEKLLRDARERLDDAMSQSDATRLEANTILEVATHTAETTRQQADDALTAAISDAEAMRLETETTTRLQRDEAAGALDVALAEATATAAGTKQEAEELLGTARSEASDLLAESRREAETLVSAAVREARDLRMRVKTEAEQVRQRNQARADEMLTIATHESEEVRSEARTAAAKIMASAEVTSTEEINRAKADAAARLATSQAQSEQLLEEARHQADQIVEDSRNEKLHLLQRIAELRGSVQAIERELQRMASGALGRSHVVKRMIEREDSVESQLALALQGDPRAMQEGVTVDISDQGMTIDDLRSVASDPFAAPDGSGRPPAARGTVDPAGPPTFDRPTMQRIAGRDARAGRSLTEAIAASRRQ